MQNNRTMLVGVVQMPLFVVCEAGWQFFKFQLTFSKLTMETLEQGVKYVIGVALVSLLLTLNIFHTLL